MGIIIIDKDEKDVMKHIKNELVKNNEIEEKKLLALKDLTSILTKIGVILENRNLMKN